VYAKVFPAAARQPDLALGNSDRRAAGAVKQYARNNPHKMGAWSFVTPNRIRYIAGRRITTAREVLDHSRGGDQRRIENCRRRRAVTVAEGEDAAFQPARSSTRRWMSRKGLAPFFAEQIAAKKEGVLFTLHVKATMMKIADSHSCSADALSVILRPIVHREARRQPEASRASISTRLSRCC